MQPVARRGLGEGNRQGCTPANIGRHGVEQGGPPIAGHDGSMATVHANSATDALARLASLVLHEAANWPLAAVQEHVSRAVDVVVHVSRGAAGARQVQQVAEVCSAEPGRGLAVRVLAESDRVLAPLTRART